jgi:LysR family transcriptional regulator, hydrogen peroxide-inducible genes activator
LTIIQLGYILALEKHQNFVQAAEACHISQPALSMQIKKLEDTLNVDIFDRSQNPVRATKIGEQILEQAKRTMKEFRHINELVNNEKRGVSGTIRLGVIPTVAPYLLPYFIKNINNNYPLLQLNIEEMTTGKIIESIEKGDLDIGILATPLRLESIKEIPLYFEKLMAYVSPENELFSKKFILSNEIDLNNLWLLEEGHCLRSQIENFCELKQKQNIVSQLNFKTGSLETIIKLVDKYMGITLLPELAVYDLKEEQKLKIRRFESEKPLREISLVTDKNYPRNAVVEAFKRTIIESLPPEILTERPEGVLGVF